MRVDALDTADWKFVVPVLQAAGQSINLDGPLTLTIVPALGGNPIVTLSSDDGEVGFVPDPVAPYIFIVSEVAKRTWKATRGYLDAGGDIMRNGTEWVGRIDLRILMGSSSTNVAAAAGSPVMVPGYPPGFQIFSPIAIGLQGAGVPPIPTGSGRFRLVAENGVTAWVPE